VSIRDEVLNAENLSTIPNFPERVQHPHLSFTKALPLFPFGMNLSACRLHSAHLTFFAQGLHGRSERVLGSRGKTAHSREVHSRVSEAWGLYEQHED